MMVTTVTTASAHEPQQQEQQPQQPQSEKVKVTEGEQILRILSSRVERAVRAATAANDVNNDETATATATTTTTTTTMMPTVQLSLKDLCRTARKYGRHEEIRTNEGARFSQLSAQLEEEENVPGGRRYHHPRRPGNSSKSFDLWSKTMPANLQNLYRARKSFAFLRRCRRVASRRRQGWFETALSNPSEALECQCCPKSGEISASLPDPCLCYKLLEKFGGESADNAFEIPPVHRRAPRHERRRVGTVVERRRREDEEKEKTKRGKNEGEEEEPPPEQPTNTNKNAKKQKHTFGLDKHKVCCARSRDASWNF